MGCLMRVPKLRGEPLAIAAVVMILVTSASIALVGVSGGSNNFALSPSDYSCSAPGATASRTFVPHGVHPNIAVNNTRAIQDAIDDAASVGGGIVKLSAGTFFIDGHLVLKSNVKLAGVGQTTVLKAGPDFLNSTGPDGGYPLITTAGAANVTIADLTADQSGNILDADAHQQARLSAYLIDVRDSINVVVDAVYTRNPFTYSIAVVQSSDFCITHCNTRVATSGLYYGLDGIHVLDSHTGQVIDNYVDQRVGTDGDDGLVAHSMHAPVYDVLYAGNTIRGGNDGDGMQLAVGNYPIYNITIQDNTFWGSPFGIRTGYWDTGKNGVVRNIVIDNNYIRDLVPGKAFPYGGNAIDIGGFGAIAPVSHITVTGNFLCNAGVIKVVKGVDNVVAHNHSCEQL
jgi:polygalacturonase